MLWLSRLPRLLAAPALQLPLAPQGAESSPKSLPVIKTYERMQQAFAGSALPANVIVQAPNVNSPAMRTAIAQLERRLPPRARDTIVPQTVGAVPGSVAGVTGLTAAWKDQAAALKARLG